MKSIPIDSGINLRLIQTEKFKTTCASVLIKRRLTREEATKTALLPMVLKRGSFNCPDVQSIHKKLEAMYGAVFDSSILKKGEEQIVQFYLEVLCGRNNNLLYEGLEFLADIILRPKLESGVFDKEFLKSEKENLKKTIDARKNNKLEYARLRCIEEMCKKEAFGVYGDGYADDLPEIDEVNLFNHYKTILQSSNIEIIVIGDFDENELVYKAKKLFAIEKRKWIKEQKKTSTLGKSSVVSLTEKAEINQAKLCMGLRADPEKCDYYSLLVANEIFGGGAESRLFNNVREKESLCYSISSFLYRFKSILLIQSGIDIANFEKALAIIKEQIKSMSRITDGEIEKAKKSLTKRICTIHDNPTAVMDFYLSQIIAEDDDDIKSVAEKVAAVTAEQASEIFKSVAIDTVYILTP